MSECCPQHQAMVVLHQQVKDELDKYHSNQQRVVQGQHELRERVALIERDTETLEAKMDKMEAQTEAILRLSISIEGMSKEVQEVINLFKDHDERIDVLEKRPNAVIADRWNEFIKTIITVLATLVVSNLLPFGK